MVQVPEKICEWYQYRQKSDNLYQYQYWSWQESENGTGTGPNKIGTSTGTGQQFGTVTQWHKIIQKKLPKNCHILPKNGPKPMILQFAIVGYFWEICRPFLIFSGLFYAILLTWSRVFQKRYNT